MSKVDIDKAIDLIVEGKSVKDIAASFNITIQGMYKMFAKVEFSTRVREAMELSASTYAEKAEEVLQMAEANQIEISRARELAQHYRWMAGKRAPKKYGDKLDIDHTSAGDKIIPTVILQTSPALEQQYGFKPEADDSLPVTDGG